MNRKTLNSKINLFYLSFILVWQPIKMLSIQIDGKGRIPFVLTLLVLIINIANNPEVKKLMFRKPFVIWLCWVIFAFVNMLIKGYNYSANTPLFYLVNAMFTPYWVLVLTCHESNVNRKRLINVMLISFLFYCVLGFFFMGRVRVEDDSSFTLGNALAIGASLTTFLACLARNNKQINGFVFGLLIVFIFVVVISTATRKAFGVALIIIAHYGLSLIGQNRRNIILVAVLAIGAYVGVNYVLDNTYMGERIQYTSEQSLKYNTVNSDSKFLQFVGDRAPHYILGWEVFKNHPITGVGLYNFQKVSGFPERLHTDYMVQFAENGLIGFLLFLWYYLWFILNLWKLRKGPVYRACFLLGSGWIMAVLFLGITAWTYESSMVYVCSGIVASFIFKYKKEIGVI